MKSSVVSMSSSHVGNKMGSGIRTVPEQSMQDFQMEIQKMLDLASTYFCIKSEFLPKNYISFYGPETQGVDSMFKAQMEEEKGQFPELIQKIREAGHQPEGPQDKSRMQTYKSSVSQASVRFSQDDIIQSKTSQLSIKQSSFVSGKSVRSAKSVKSPRSVKPTSQRANVNLSILQDPVDAPPIIQQPSSSFQKKPSLIHKSQDPIEPSYSIREQSKTSRKSSQSGNLMDDTNQFQDYSDYNDSVLSSVAQKLASIKEQSSIENSIISLKAPLLDSIQVKQLPKQKQVLQDWTTVKKDGKNKSTGKQSGDNQGMKTILELQRIQLSIRQLEQKFQHLMSYQLQFPNEPIPQYQISSFRKKSRKLCLGQVIQISDLARR